MPNEVGHLNYALSWFKPTNGTPDYYNSCFDSAMQWYNVMDVPYNFIGYQNAKSGNAYAGIIVFEYGANYREYLEAKLDNPLNAGVKYFVSFHVSRADSCIWATDDLGAFFSIDSALGTTWYQLPDTPQVKNSNGNIISDRVNWTFVSGAFVAQGGERFVTIGNFDNDINTDTITVPGGNPINPGDQNVYYFIDDVCVSTDSLTCNSTVGINEVKNTYDFVLFPNPFSDKLNISVKNNEPAEVILYDITSRKILNQTFTNSITINTAQLTKGIYIYEVRDKKGVVKKGKVVKE